MYYQLGNFTLGIGRCGYGPEIITNQNNDVNISIGVGL